MTPFAAETARLRAAQADWAGRPVRDRLKPVREFRHLLVERADDLTAAVLADVRRPPDEVVGTDLVPTAAACKFLLNRGERILRPRRVGGTPLWLFGCRDTVHRRPFGVVGLIATWNYPVYLRPSRSCTPSSPGTPSCGSRANRPPGRPRCCTTCSAGPGSRRT